MALPPAERIREMAPRSEALALAEVKRVANLVTTATAISAAFDIANIHGGQGRVRRFEADVLKGHQKNIDTAAAHMMRQFLDGAPFRIVAVGSEGRKEAHPEKQGEAMPTVLGVFGSGEHARWMVNDPIEGTKPAAQNIPGASSVMALSSEEGVMATPDDVDYMDKLFGPPSLKGKIEIEAPVEHNLAVAARTYGISPENAHQIHVVMLERDRNAAKMEAVRNYGATLHLIPWGDLVPSLLALREPGEHRPEVFMVMGSGGWEEGVIAAVGAKALGAHAEGKMYREDDAQQGVKRPVLTVDHLVPGTKEDSIVSLTTVTPDMWFGIPGVVFNGAVESHTLTITHSEFSIDRSHTSKISRPLGVGK